MRRKSTTVTTAYGPKGTAVKLRHLAWHRVGIALLLAASLALTACGSQDDGATGTESAAGGDGSAMQEAKQAIDEHRGIPKFSLEAPPVDVTKAKGKTVFAIPIASTNEFNTTIDSLMADISKELGIDFVEYENQGTPTEWAKGIEQAIARKADVIIMMGGGDPSVVMPQIKRAKAAGIPTIVSHYFQNGQVPPEVEQELGAAVTVGFNEAATLMTDYAFQQEGDKLNPLIITAKEAVPSDGMVESIQTELKRLCPSCKSTVINVPVADWASKMQGEVQSALAKDPSINYILPLYDPMVMGAASGVNAAGRSGSVKIASYATTPSVLKLIQDGDVVQMDVGESTDWVAHATMDQALRLMAGEPPVPADGDNERLGLRVFDDTNVDETGTPPSSEKGFGNDYVDGYRKLWGLK